MHLPMGSEKKVHVAQRRWRFGRQTLFRTKAFADIVPYVARESMENGVRREVWAEIASQPQEIEQ